MKPLRRGIGAKGEFIKKLPLRIYPIEPQWVDGPVTKFFTKAEF